MTSAPEATPVKARKASDQVNTYTVKAQKLFASEQAEEALAVVEEGLSHEDHVRLWRLKARLLVFFGQEKEARQILARVLPTSWYPGFWEVAQSGLPLSYALLSGQHKVAYFPVRKCSSTTLHNAMRALNGGDMCGEDIHENVRQYHLLERTKQRQTLADHFQFLVVRSPVDRVRSFYYGNVLRRDHLFNDTSGKDTFYGLKTRPTYEFFLDHLAAYRRTFLTVRNHTDPLTAYVGADAGLFDWIGNVSQTQALVDMLSQRSGIQLPSLHEMKGDKPDGLVPAITQAEQSLETAYALDYQTYGKWF